MSPQETQETQEKENPAARNDKSLHGFPMQRPVISGSGAKDSLVEPAETGI